MKLYNTLTRRVDKLEPQQPPLVTVYTCGPTVYDYPHIGNWFTFIRYDLLVRTLRLAGYKPKWVMNITDVGHLTSDADEGEDKLETGARREGKNAWQVAEFYSDYFLNGLKRLNITQPFEIPRATEHIQEQIDLIKDLEDKGYTYKTSDGIYYDTSKFNDYGLLARLDVDNLKAGARVEHNPEKRNTTDFALWKFSPKDHKRDMEWPSPWGVGFPGWHLECSAMCLKYLGATIDIHAGGIEHIPVHHTNEIAQSEAATGKKLANYWLHMNHVNVDGTKISKSLRNTISLEDVIKKDFNLQALRLLVLESHYRTQAEFSWDVLMAAQNRLKNLEAAADLRWQYTEAGKFGGESITRLKDSIQESLEQDLNSPAALAHLSTAIKSLESDGLNSKAKVEYAKLLKWLDQSLGLKLSDRTDISESEKELINKREVARASQNWNLSDDLRERLHKAGIGLRDTDYGAIWYRL